MYKSLRFAQPRHLGPSDYWCHLGGSEEEWKTFRYQGVDKWWGRHCKVLLDRSKCGIMAVTAVLVLMNSKHIIC